MKLNLVFLSLALVESNDDSFQDLTASANVADQTSIVIKVTMSGFSIISNSVKNFSFAV